MGNQKIKVVLLNPPLKNVIRGATPDFVNENRGENPPMGLLYVQAAVERSRHDSVFLDANLEGLTHKDAAAKALSYAPDIVGIQAMTFTLPDAYLCVKELKKLNPDVMVVIGGPHPTIYPKETASLEGVDFAFAGEGEFNFITFLDNLHEKENWAKVPGLAYVGRNGVVFTEPSLIADIDKVPFPARSSSQYERYSSVLAEDNPITIMITSRGCPFGCIFCNRMGREYRYHSALYVLDEMGEIARLGVREVFIHDDTFTLKRERVKEICEGIIERGYAFRWEARTRVDCVDEELLALMKRAGCRRLSFGVESGSEAVLKSMKKGIDLNRAEKVFRFCKSIGIKTLADFIFGNLGEKKEDIEKTLEFSRRIDPDYVQYSILSPYPATPLYRIGLEKGILERDVWHELSKDPLMKFKSPVWTEHFTEEDLIKLTSEAYRAFYMRPKFIFKQLKRINSIGQIRTMARAAKGMLLG